MNIVILDLEWNAAYSRKLQGYINEIIQFGAVKCGPDLVKIDEFSCLVKPQVGKRMNPYTAELTSLTVESLSGGLAFPAAVSKFRKWAGDCLLMTWSNSDVLALMENCRYFTGSERVPFLSRYCNLQRYARERIGAGGEQPGLETAAGLLGLDISQMAHHQALDDSLMALEILRKVYDEEAIRPFIDVCDGEFYRRAAYKTSYLSDLRDPRVKREWLRFTCPKCGGKASRTTRWTPKNKGFRAEFRCSGCGHPFAGRLLLKQKYEGIIVNKKTYPVPVLESPRKAVPGPVGGLRLDLAEGVGVLRFPSLEACGIVNAAFSTRLGGVSQKEFAAMNLGFGRGDEEENVAENYRLFCRAAGFDPQSLVTGNQDHRTNVRRVSAEHRGIGVWREKDMESVDGLCTDDPAVTLVIYCADCVPLYFVDEKHRAIGLAHAGWRGTAAGMAKVMVERMVEEFGTRPEDLTVAVGPSICRGCFEVDEPVAMEFLALQKEFSLWGDECFVTGPTPVPGQDGGQGEMKYHVDLWECNRRFLLAAGVLPERVAISGVCTVDESTLLFSHRKTCGKRGSNAAFLSLRAE